MAEATQDKKRGELHQVLAVEPDLEGELKRVLAEAIVTFGKRREHFDGAVKTLEMFAEDRQDENAVEHKALTTTVMAKLSYIRTAFEKRVDAAMQKEATNQVARADLAVGGKVLAEGLPATALLFLEGAFKRLREVVEAVPTLAPGIEWVTDPEARMPGTFKAAHPKTTTRTEKQAKYEVIVNATPEHPAQVDKGITDVAIGRYTLEMTSGMITPARKSELLVRCDQLIRGAKRARMKANNAEIVDTHVGKAALDFLLAG